MSCSEGPNIVTNGLILHLDASNRKSFSGIGTERIGGILPAFNNWSGLTGSSTAYNANVKTGVFLTTLTGGGVNWWYSVNGAQACSSSTQYMITAKVKYTGGIPHTNLFYVRQYNSSGAQTSESGKFSSSNMKYIGDGFYLAWALFTTDSTATSFYVHGYEYSGGMNIWLEDVQCKLAGMSDISGNNNNGNLSGTMSVSSSNGGVMQLNSTNYIYTGLNLSSGAFTVMGAARYASVGGRIITSGNNNWLLGHWGVTTENYYSEGWVSSAPSGPSDTNWRILTSTGNTSTDIWNMYVNGSLTFSNSGGSAGPNNLGININSERSSSEVGVLLAYNRTLSADEVKQNFYSLRGRFGL